MRDRRFVSLLFVVIIITVLSGCRKKPASANADTLHNRELLVVESSVFSESVHTKEIPAPVMQEHEYADYVTPERSPQKIDLVCDFNAASVVLDGIADEAVWQTASPITTLDFSSQRPIELRSFHDDEMIYILATFPDEAPSETHKSWVWDKDEQVYKPGNDREDMLVLKWRMSGDSLSFLPELAQPHTADIWFWKARRTNPGGYLDDKHQCMMQEQEEGTTPITSDQYGTLYLLRKGDAGKSAYEEQIFFDYYGDNILKYYLREPEGSRADIRGKGRWENGYWTVEIQRKLDTGHDDDIAFSLNQQYEFGVSLYEMSGIDKVEGQWFQPLYRTGNVFDTLTLMIQ